MPKRTNSVAFDDTFYCRNCDECKPASDFSSWALNGKHHLCRKCCNANSKAAAKLKNGSLNRILLSKLRRLMHKEGCSFSVTQRLELETMDGFMRKFGSRSIFSGVTDPKRLTVAVWNRDRPAGFDNVIICTHAEASQHNKRNLAHYNPKFTKHVHTKLLMPTIKVSSQSDPKEGLYTDPYPPKSEFNHGVSSNVMSWFLHNFQVPHPIAHNPSRYSRYARLSRLPEATLVACN